MTFKAQLFQNFIWRSFYFASVFLLNIVVARNYQAEQSGWINFISTNFALAITFGTLSLEVAILYFGSSGKISKEKLSTFALLWSILLSILFYLTASLFVNKNDAIASKGLLKFAASNYFIGIIFINFFVNLFYMQKEFMMPNAILGIMNFILVLLIPNNFLGLQWFDNQSYLYLYYFWYILQAFLLIFSYFIYDKKVVFKLLKIRELIQIFKFAIIAFFANAVYFLLCRIDYWFINLYRADRIDLGNYIQASKLGQTLLIFSLIISTSVFVSTSSTPSDDYVKRLMIIIRNFIVFFIGLFFVTLFLGRTPLIFIFGHSFDRMYWPLVALMPGILCLSILTIISSYFSGNNRAIINVYSALAGLVVIVIGDVLFIKRFGIIGAAVVSSFGYATSMIYSLYRFHQINSFSIKSLIFVSASDFNWVTKYFKPKSI